MSSKKLLNDNFTIKDLKLIDEFNMLCKHLKNKKNFEERVIYLYSNEGLNFDRLKKFLFVIKSIYDKKVKEEFDKQEIDEFIPFDNINFISLFIKEHDEFAEKLTRIIKISSCYTKSTIKEKSDIYIRKVLPIYHKNGMFKVLYKIITEDKFNLNVLCNDYFDNLPYFALASDISKLKTSTFNLNVIFDITKIIFEYDKLLKMHKYSKNFNNETISLADEARYINSITPEDFYNYLKNTDISTDELNEVVSDYKKYYNERLSIDKEKARQDEQILKEENLSKYVLMVSLYVNSKVVSLEDYLSLNKIEEGTFYKAVNALKDNNHPIYQLYLDKIKDSKDLIDFEKLLDGINNGVVENGVKIREFDLVDYYLLTKITPAEAKRLANKNLPYSDYLKVYSFTKKYINDRELTAAGRDNLFKMNVMYPIENDVYTVTNDDKMNALLELDRMGVPLTQLTYKIYLRRYVMNNLKNEKGIQKKIGTK